MSRKGAEYGKIFVRIGVWAGILFTVVQIFPTGDVHGKYVAVKTEGSLNSRMRLIFGRLLPVVVLLSLISLPVTLWIRPGIADNYLNHPAGWIVPFAVAVSLAGIFRFNRSGDERMAFLCSCAYMTAMLAGAAFALYPTLLPATNPANSLNIYNASASRLSLSSGLRWWIAGMLVAVGYFVFIYRMFRGKVTGKEPHGY